MERPFVASTALVMVKVLSPIVQGVPANMKLFRFVLLTQAESALASDGIRTEREAIANKTLSFRMAPPLGYSDTGRIPLVLRAIVGPGCARSWAAAGK